jgi:hypothetical protein
MGIPTSQNPNTPEGLESRLSVRIRIIPSELPHSTELELGKLHRSRTGSGKVLRLSYSEDSRQARKSSGHQNLTSLSTLQE